MRHQVTISTPPASVEETAEILGVSVARAKKLANLRVPVRKMAGSSKPKRSGSFRAARKASSSGRYAARASKRK